MPFSYTAPTYSKEDEERDYADLLPEQKEDILDDVYGRNAEEIAALNEREITQQELDAFDKELENLPAEVNAEAAIAAKTVICPELVELETNPSLFLRCENYNPHEGAKRFAAYWDLRVDLLGHEKAFLPISLAEGGAYHEDEEIIRMMRESPTYRYILPNDTHGRSVLFGEADQQNSATMSFSREAKIKYAFYMMHRLMKQQSSISRGFVVLVFFDDRGQFKLTGFDRLRFKQNARITRCIPITLRAVHYSTSKSSFLLDLMLSAAKMFWSRELRLRSLRHHLTKQETEFPRVVPAVEVLEPYGFEKEGLPECMGGTYQFITSWAEEHMEYDGGR